eukprot:6190282-Pleurochrysis_carterae.AAC.1
MLTFASHTLPAHLAFLTGSAAQLAIMCKVACGALNCQSFLNIDSSAAVNMKSDRHAKATGIDASVQPSVVNTVLLTSMHHKRGST